MKALFLILFLLPLISTAQINLNNNSLSIDSIGVITAQDVYGKAAFRDSARVITGGTNVIVSNATSPYVLEDFRSDDCKK